MHFSLPIFPGRFKFALQWKSRGWDWTSACKGTYIWQLYNRRLQDVVTLYKVKNHQRPKYICEFFNMNTSGYALRNVDFWIPRFNTVNFGRHSTRYLGPVLWSKLSPEVRQSETLHSFKNRIRRIHLSTLLDGQCYYTLCNS